MRRFTFQSSSGPFGVFTERRGVDRTNREFHPPLARSPRRSQPPWFRHTASRRVEECGLAALSGFARAFEAEAPKGMAAWGRRPSQGLQAALLAMKAGEFGAW